MSKSISKNFLYNLLYQIVTLVSPLITVPYVSRILGKEGIGIFSYTNSITQYFILIGTLGIASYGNRQIAYVRDDKNKLSRTFWSICVFKVITTVLSLIFYLSIFSFDYQYGYIFIIQSINILSATLDITWLFTGLEDFKKTVTRNLFMKILCILGVFILVKTRNDLNIYILLMALMNFLGNFIMWLYVPKIVLKVKLNLKEIFSNFKPTVYLFIPQLAVQIYSILDKTQLGILSNVGEVGLYEQSQKIIRLLLGIITCLSAVMLPRMSNIFANGDTKTMNKYFNVSLKCVTYISIPMAFGLIAISDQFVPWFFGPDFIQVSVLIKVLTPIFFFIGISSVMGNQYLIPTNRIRPYTFSVVLGSVVNLLLNLILIPKYQAVGTCIASVFAEFSVALVQCILLKDCIDIGKFCINLIKYIISGIVMITVIKALTFSLESSILTTMIQVLLGFISYFLMLTMMKEEINLIAIKSILSKIRKKDFVHFS